jgi:hypothetical protein
MTREAGTLRIATRYSRASPYRVRGCKKLIIDQPLSVRGYPESAVRGDLVGRQTMWVALPFEELVHDVKTLACGCWPVVVGLWVF